MVSTRQRPEVRGPGTWKMHMRRQGDPSNLLRSWNTFWLAMESKQSAEVEDLQPPSCRSPVLSSPTPFALSPEPVTDLNLLSCNLLYNIFNK